MPNEGIFALIYKSWEQSNPNSLPFWDSEFGKDADWDRFLKVPKDGFSESPGTDKKGNPTGNDDEDNLVDADPDNLFMTLANPT